LPSENGECKDEILTYIGKGFSYFFLIVFSSLIFTVIFCRNVLFKMEKKIRKKRMLLEPIFKDIEVLDPYKKAAKLRKLKTDRLMKSLETMKLKRNT